MVSNHTLSMLTNMIVRGYERSYDIFGFSFPESLYRAIRDLELSPMDGEDVFKALADLNIHALNERYWDGDDMVGELEYDEDYDIWKPGHSVQQWHYQFYKSLSCYLYQCSEGNTPSKDLYKALTTLEHNLMYFIVTRQPEYQKAEWR